MPLVSLSDWNQFFKKILMAIFYKPANGGN